MKEFLMQTYTLILPIVLGYIIWLLKNQKHYRDANSKGTMILLKVKLFEYHDKYMKLGSIHLTHLKIFVICTNRITN